MSWRYRVIKIKKPVEENDPTGFNYGIHEVYNDTKGEIHTYTDAVTIEQDSLEDLKWQLESMLKALNQEVLTPDHFIQKHITGDLDGFRDSGC